jgi:hypothetical protein
MSGNFLILLTRNIAAILHHLSACNYYATLFSTFSFESLSIIAKDTFGFLPLFLSLFYDANTQIEIKFFYAILLIDFNFI